MVILGSGISAKAPLRGFRVLVIEDEYFLADDIARALRALGGAVAGPVGETEDALNVLREETVHAAVVDLNLRGDVSLEVARTLRSKALPFVFTTGYARATIDPEFRDVLTWEKPIDVFGMAQALAGLIRQAQ
jgi:CheY-like chemotaxis protein